MKELDIRKYKKHEKKFPWGLVRKIIIAAILIGLFYYLQKEMRKNGSKGPEFTIEVEEPANQ